MITATYRDNHRPTNMTYILGSTCKDGVVLVGDRKIVYGDGSSHDYDDKIFPLDPWMIVGSSGTLALFQKFREQITEYVMSPNCERTVVALTNQIESITRELNKAYRDVLQGQDFDVLLGIKSTAGSVLQYVYPYGLAEGVSKYKVIGHGEPYGAFFLKHWWEPDMTMLDVAELGFFIIRYIQEFELDNTVGIGDGNPQVLLIPNTPIPDNSPPEIMQSLLPHFLSEDEMKPMKVRVQRRITRLKRASWSMR
jgi:20S proteasome alpha/beta subunit